jgi:hypothetical protein
MVVDTMLTPPDLRHTVSQLFPDESEEEQALVKSDNPWTVEWENDERELPNLTDNHTSRSSYTRTMMDM